MTTRLIGDIHGKFDRYREIADVDHPTDQQQQEVRNLEAERQVLERKLQRLPEALRAYLMGKFSMRNE